MRRPYFGYAFLAGLAALALTAATQVAPLLAATSFLETFTGNPSSPTAYSPPGWDVAIHSRDENTWQSLDAMDAGHGMDCSGPPHAHALGGDYPSHVFLCKDHVMTSLRASGYGEIVLVPPALVDFSNGESVIRWDMSTLRTSGRDWVDFWVSPYADNIQLPFNQGDVDLHGMPRNGISMRMGFSSGKSIFTGFANRAGVKTDFAVNCCQAWENFLVPDAARRDTMELRISRTHVKFWMPAYNKVFSDTTIPDLGFDQGVFQIGHHSYNPSKDCTPSANLTCTANTWHWDNVSINPSIPFQINRLTPRFVANNGVVTLPAPSQAGDMLRFSALGTVTLSFDGGATFGAAPKQPATVSPTSFPQHFSSYFVPIPTGTQSVKVRLAQDGWYTGPFGAKDFASWRR